MSDTNSTAVEADRVAVAYVDAVAYANKFYGDSSNDRYVCAIHDYFVGRLRALGVEIEVSL